MSEHPQQCAAGFEPDSTSSKCVLCENGSFSPTKGSVCMKCGQNTFSSDDRKSCLAYDIVSNNKFLYPVHLLSDPDLFCLSSKNQNICDESSIGPVLFNQDQYRPEHPVFFFSNQKPLGTERYEFHISQFQPETSRMGSYIYMLFDV